jgi:predicted  nucleic acid-binding Zn-ribbon protein
VQAAGKLFESARLGFERAQVDLAVLQEQADELEAKINDQSLLLAEIDTRMATLQSLMSSPQKK